LSDFNVQSNHPLHHSKGYTASTVEIYNFAFVCALLRIGSIFVAFITSPLTFNFPDIKSRCAFALPAINFAKSSSLSCSVTEAFLPSGASPLPTTPSSLRSMCQEAVSPLGFLRVKAKMAPPCLMAVFFSEGSDWREEFMRSKAVEEGKASGGFG
jgi:hypothetical protein